MRPIVYDGSFQNPAVDYYLVGGLACRTPRLATSEWNGKTLHVGSLDPLFSASGATAPTAGVGKYGMLNLNGGSISVPEGAVRIVIENAGASAKPPSADYLLPLCTVADAETAEALQAKFALPGASPWRGYPVAGWGTRVNTGDNAGSVTLGVVFGTPGTIMIFH